MQRKDLQSLRPDQTGRAPRPASPKSPEPPQAAPDKSLIAKTKRGGGGGYVWGQCCQKGPEKGPLSTELPVYVRASGFLAGGGGEFGVAYGKG